jgi:hypothetical protein
MNLPQQPVQRRRGRRAVLPVLPLHQDQIRPPRLIDRVLKRRQVHPQVPRHALPPGEVEQ